MFGDWSDTGVKVSRHVQVDVQVRDVPAMSVKQKRKVVQFLPERLHMQVHESVDGQWESAVGVRISGPHLNDKTGRAGMFDHGGQYGTMHQPLPEWARTRLLKSDIPTEVRQAVLKLVWIVDHKIEKPYA